MSVLQQLISRIPGLDDYNDQVKQNAALTGQNIQQGAQYMTLQGAMEDRAAKRQTLEREAGYRSNGPPATGWPPARRDSLASSEAPQLQRRWSEGQSDPARGDPRASSRTPQ